MRVLVGAIASLTLIIAGALVMDWYRAVARQRDQRRSRDRARKVGYMLALTTISLTVATAYMFRPEPEGPGGVVRLGVAPSNRAKRDMGCRRSQYGHGIAPV